jgi:SAM-dependent methyltransferase
LPDFEQIYSHEHEIEAGHWWFTSRLERIHELLPAGDARIFDLGCGSGLAARTFEKYGRVVGGDISAAPLAADAAAGRSRLATRAEQLPFKDGTFDLVTALDVVEHLEHDVPAIREMLRVLRPGGILLITVPAVPILYGPHDRVLGHWRRYSSAELRRVVRRSGGNVLRMDYFLTLLFPVLLAWRLITKVFGPGGGRSDGGRPLPAWLNRVLGAVMGVDRRLAPRPFGSTLICVASLPERPPHQDP